MRLVSGTAVFAAALLCGCMEGAPGPAGPSGQGGFGPADSLVYDPMEPYLIWNKRDTNFVFSPAAQARYDKIDKSRYLIDSITTADGKRMLSIFIRAKYDPDKWWTTQRITGNHMRSNTDSVGWYLKTKDSYISTQILSVDVRNYPSVGYYYPGKGFDLFYSQIFTYEGEAKILYWR